ncbi:MAG: hypothetical protein OXB93_05075 [Cytophagales bacterium]|nr:hypothetical protein [Cytophagales bacterium]
MSTKKQWEKKIREVLRETEVDDPGKALTADRIRGLLIETGRNPFDDEESLKTATIQRYLGHGMKGIGIIKEGRKRLYYLPKQKKTEAPPKGTSDSSSKRGEKNKSDEDLKYEKDLYDPLSYCFGGYKKRGEYCFGAKVHTQIFEGQGGGKGGQEWTFPDVVGVQFEEEKDGKISPLETRSNHDILSFLERRTLGDNRFRLFSFEVKREITQRSFHDCYMQAVKNSSWAHEGYLVAARVDEKINKDNTKFKAITDKFGIGIVEIREDGSTDIRIEATPVEEVNWDDANDLFRSRSFRNFIKGVNDSLGYNDIQHFYDAIGKEQKRIGKIRKDIPRIHKKIIQSLDKKS